VTSSRAPRVFGFGSCRLVLVACPRRCVPVVVFWSLCSGRCVLVVVFSWLRSRGLVLVVSFSPLASNRTFRSSELLSQPIFGPTEIPGEWL
jgi:hypothetical protein